MYEVPTKQYLHSHLDISEYLYIRLYLPTFSDVKLSDFHQDICGITSLISRNAPEPFTKGNLNLFFENWRIIPDALSFMHTFQINFMFTYYMQIFQTTDMAAPTHIIL